jgi:hypothetical protein
VEVDCAEAGVIAKNGRIPMEATISPKKSLAMNLLISTSSSFLIFVSAWFGRS